MKNITFKLLFVVLGFGLLQACGETEEERRAREQARMDSLLKAQQQEIAEQMAQLEEENNSTSSETNSSDENSSSSDSASEGYTFAENGQYAVQVGAFRSEEKANGFINKWADRNYPNVYTVKIGEEEYGDVWFRVRIGYFDTKEDASRLGEELAKEINSGYWVSKVR